MRLMVRVRSGWDNGRTHGHHTWLEAHLWTAWFSPPQHPAILLLRMQLSVVLLLLQGGDLWRLLSRDKERSVFNWYKRCAQRSA